LAFGLLCFVSGRLFGFQFFLGLIDDDNKNGYWRKWAVN
jgi:hypothetical protein